ncbi:hypothetical protein HOU02_gp077 [Caulobacter phage CcrBL9]|uniref:Uncharacterized protein n=1 Tax=Caulobacter phage CcrBL9 TaxID=2283270 RepID=A0A385EB24_9CAUD|nr:hypothetical protein HOU02_gp077 [Caulobacter phage CcrBL9]AXQ69101.1 hypothetical protein CcrBL9_gp077c [Caulobacter phage CcrBL9]
MTTKVEFWQEVEGDPGGRPANVMVSSFEADDLLALSIQEGVKFKLQGAFWIVDRVHRNIDSHPGAMTVHTDTLLAYTQSIRSIQAIVRRATLQRGIEA